MMHQFLDKKQIIRRKKNIRNIIIFSIFIVVFSFGFLSWTGQFLNYIGRPVWKSQQYVVGIFSNMNYLLREKASLSSENKKLKEENLNLSLSMIDYQILRNDVDKLKETLGRIPEVKNLILGNILTKPNHSPYDTIVIDIGNNLNIKEGNMVYADGNIPIGTVEKVYEDTSLVSLYTTPSKKIEGFINGPNVSVELIGRGGGNFEMIIPIELQVSKGTTVYLPGSTSLVIAQVDDVISSPSDPFKKVLLSSPINIQDIKWVEVSNK